MRAIATVLACSAFLLTLAGPGMQTDARADAVKASPELTVFTDEETRPADGRPTVLRGSATKRGTVDGRLGAAFQPSAFEFVAGEKLWFVDPVSGAVIVCDERRTSRVGSGFIGCIADGLPFGYDD